MNNLVKTTLFGLAIAVMATPAFAQGNGQVIPAKAVISALDLPLDLMKEAKTNYTAVKDYTCTLVSQERVKGNLGDENIVEMKFKEPFSVSMRWLSPRTSQGQEVVYVKGKNNNKMLVKSNRLGAKVLGFMSLNVNDPRVVEHSRHNITEAGIGNMIEQCLVNWEVERKIGKTDVKDPVHVRYAGRECIQIELTRGEKRAELEYFRTVILLEKSSKLPIRLQNYDWPRQGGPAGGELMESFSYVNLQFNTGLKDTDFNR